MDTIAQDLKSYEKEYGKYPATLKEMQPKYLNNLTVELDYVVFRGKQDGENKVVAHSSEKVKGPIIIILQNGSVAEIGRGELGRVLTQGYTAKVAEKPAAGPQDSVKPPKPPEF